MSFDVGVVVVHGGAVVAQPGGAAGGVNFGGKGAFAGLRDVDAEFAGGQEEGGGEGDVGGAT